LRQALTRDIRVSPQGGAEGRHRILFGAEGALGSQQPELEIFSPRPGDAGFRVKKRGRVLCSQIDS
jgi:hypothetical protein